jgi:hypothetical protein
MRYYNELSPEQVALWHKQQDDARVRSAKLRLSVKTIGSVPSSEDITIQPVSTPTED